MSDERACFSSPEAENSPTKKRHLSFRESKKKSRQEKEMVRRKSIELLLPTEDPASHSPDVSPFAAAVKKSRAYSDGNILVPSHIQSIKPNVDDGDCDIMEDDYGDDDDGPQMMSSKRIPVLPLTTRTTMQLAEQQSISGTLKRVPKHNVDATLRRRKSSHQREISEQLHLSQAASVISDDVVPEPRTPETLDLPPPPPELLEQAHPPDPPTPSLPPSMSDINTNYISPGLPSNSASMTTRMSESYSLPTTPQKRLTGSPGYAPTDVPGPKPNAGSPAAVAPIYSVPGSADGPSSPQYAVPYEVLSSPQSAATQPDGSRTFSPAPGYDAMSPQKIPPPPKNPPPGPPSMPPMVAPKPPKPIPQKVPPPTAPKLYAQVSPVGERLSQGSPCSPSPPIRQMLPSPNTSPQHVPPVPLSPHHAMLPPRPPSMNNSPTHYKQPRPQTENVSPYSSPSRPPSSVTPSPQSTPPPKSQYGSIPSPQHAPSRPQSTLRSPGPDSQHYHPTTCIISDLQRVLTQKQARIAPKCPPPFISPEPPNPYNLPWRPQDDLEMLPPPPAELLEGLRTTKRKPPQPPKRNESTTLSFRGGSCGSMPRR